MVFHEVMPLDQNRIHCSIIFPLPLRGEGESRFNAFLTIERLQSILARR